MINFLFFIFQVIWWLNSHNAEYCILMSMELQPELQLQGCKNVFEHQYEL